jgi:hypothetical protein
MKYKIYLRLIFCILFVSGCVSSRIAFKPGYDFTKVTTIGLGDFNSFMGYRTSGELVRDAFTRQFIRAGYTVKQSINNVDVIVTGSVTDFSPSKRYLFYSGNAGENTQVIVTSPALEISGSNVYNLGTAFGLGTSAQILVSNATAGVTARLIDPGTNEIVWSNSFSYEGLDIQTAVEGVVNHLVKSIIVKK